jgi:hypothetical protein
MIPSCLAAQNSLPSTSITKMNSIGDNESPWRTPRLCLIVRPGWPLSKMRDEAEDNSSDIQRRHSALKPIAHDTVSKALEMSSFSSTFGILFFLRYTAARCTYLKLSWIVRPRMKAFWFAETSSASFCASLVANRSPPGLLHLASLV